MAIEVELWLPQARSVNAVTYRNTHIHRTWNQAVRGD